MCRGLAPAAAEDAIGRLERAGALINLAGTVVLRPGEVAAALNLVGATASPVGTHQGRGAGELAALPPRSCCFAVVSSRGTAAAPAASPPPCLRRPSCAPQLLPTSTSHTEQRLEEVQRELQAMREQEAAIGRRAAWRQRGIIWGGLAGQVRRSAVQWR